MLAMSADSLKLILSQVNWSKLALDIALDGAQTLTPNTFEDKQIYIYIYPRYFNPAAPKIPYIPIRLRGQSLSVTNTFPYLNGSVTDVSFFSDNGSKLFEAQFSEPITPSKFITSANKYYDSAQKTFDATGFVKELGIVFPGAPAYSIIPSSASINEGGKLKTTIRTSNVADGTQLYWALSGSGINASDFSTGALTGSGTISKNTFSFDHVLKSDNSQGEGNELLTIKLYSDSSRKQQVGKAVSVIIYDTSRKNRKPLASLKIQEFLSSQAGKAQDIQQLLAVKALDGDSITKYEFKDSNSDKKTGYFRLAEKQYRQGTTISVAADDLKNLNYVAGAEGSFETISFRAFAGKEWSDWSEAKWRTATNRWPRVVNGNITFSKQASGSSIDVRTLFSASDLDYDPIVHYNFWNSSSDSKTGYFVFKGRIYQGKELYSVKAADLSQLRYVPGQLGSWESVWIGASDGKANSAWAKATWAVQSNKMPTSNVKANTFLSPKTSVAINHLLVASDRDGDQIQSYILSNPAGAGYFEYGGKQFQGKDLVLSSNEIAKVRYVAGDAGSSEQIGLQVFDGYQYSSKSSAVWQVSKQSSQPGFKRLIGINIDRQLKLGDILKVPNSKDFMLFLGPDFSIANRAFNPEISGLGVKAGLIGSTGATRLKAGLEIAGGYDLGQMRVKGGGLGHFTYDKNTGLKASAVFINPEISLTVPSAFLKLDAVAKINVNPTLSAYYDAGIFGKGNQNITLPKINFDKRLSLINLNTNSLMGNGLTQSLNFGSFFKTDIRLPSFGLPGKLNAAPQAIALDNKWKSGFGDSVAYGYSGRSTLLDFKLSLDSLAKYFGLPLSFSGSILSGALALEAKIVDASIGAKSEFIYGASVAVKPNFFVTVEGSADRYKLGSDFSVSANKIRDVNRNGQIRVEIAADPIIGVNASARIASSLSASVSGLSGNAKVDVLGFKRDFSVGPIFSSGDISLGSLGNINLFEQTKVFGLSEILPGLQSQLRFGFDIPA